MRRIPLIVVLLVAVLNATASAIVVTAVFHTAMLPPPTAPAATVVTQLAGWADATIRRAAPDNAEGASEMLWMTKWFERALCDFMPALATIASNMQHAELYLYNIAGNAGEDATFTWNAHLLTNRWVEDEVTWSNRATATAWQHAGGDYSNRVAGGEIVCQDEEYHRFDITSAMQAWNTQADACGGILLRCLSEGDAEPCYTSVDNVHAAEECGLWREAALQQPFLYAIFDDGTAPDQIPGAFAIRLSNDWRTTLLRWSATAAADVYVCTNRYYSTDPADWFLRAENVSGEWADVQAAGTPSVYYRLISAPHGSYTSAYDVGKFSVAIQQGDGVLKRENWVACPFELLDDDGQTLAAKPFDDMMLEMCLSDQAGFATLRDQVQSQEPVGGNTRTATRGNGVWGVDHPSATNWYAHKLYRIVIHQNHTGPAKVLNFVGRVRTDACTDVAAIQPGDGIFKKENWVAWPYPSQASFDDANLPSVLSNQAGFATLRDQVQSQEPIGGNTRTATRGDGGWFVDDPAATNCVGGKGYRIIIHELHTSPATNWYAPRPY